MSTVDIVASVALILGALMSLLAGIAVLRFPDTMSRIHAATKPQVLGIILLMLGVGLQIGSPAVIGMLVLIVILQFVTAPVSAHLTVRVAFRNAQDDERRSTEHPSHPAADDGPVQLAHALAEENLDRRAPEVADSAGVTDPGAGGGQPRGESPGGDNSGGGKRPQR